MKFCLWIVLFLFLLTGALTQDFDLSDALDDVGLDLSGFLDDLVPPTPAKPKEQPKPPKQPDGGFGLDLEDAFGPEKPTGGGLDLSDFLDDLVPPTPAKPQEQPKPPKQPDGGFGLDLEDAFGPEKPTGGGLDLSDFLDDLVPPTPAKPKEQPKPPKQPDGGFGLDLEDAFGPACLKDLDQKLNRIIENQEKLLKLLEQQRPRNASRFWSTR
ncbi:microtubule-associated protein homolog maph-1.1-like isoform X1 [Acanthopagrus latus]|uniref:microtubule-associated protein homolog maph-1.1-like isoform X1 n=1 Tax=Acanthopagrus latus TaxID=8177 RepID=UPI00187C8253|nr:microtubule-associated protein homolog maph-1.1-like isoform X1 [Acanthopagrus latus]